MLSSGVSMVQALEVTADVVDNLVYKEIIQIALSEVKGWTFFCRCNLRISRNSWRVDADGEGGEETGSLSEILKTLADFYRREVNNAVDTLIGLIEPIMIVLLGLGVGVLLASVLMPIYNMTSAFKSAKNRNLLRGASFGNAHRTNQYASRCLSLVSRILSILADLTCCPHITKFTLQKNV